MELSLFQYSQLSCIAVTLVLAIAMMFIGNRKARTLRWLFMAKWAIIIVLMMVCCCILVQFAYQLAENYPKINTAIAITILYAITLILVFVFFPIAYDVPDKWSRMRLTLMVFLTCCALAWIAIACPHPLNNIMVASSAALYLFELSRITILFMAKYNKLKTKNIQQYSSEESAHLSYLNFLANGVVLVALYALLYLVLAFWNQNTMAIMNFAAILLWLYLFVAIVNVIINYNPDGAQGAPHPMIGDERPIEQIQPSKQDTTSTQSLSQEPHIELNQLVINRLDRHIKTLINEKFYCSHGITMESLAKQLNTNRSYLSRYINITYGCSFNTWLTQLRINEASQLLIDSPTLSLDKIALMVGFASRSHFMSSFKATKGVTPGKWREQHSS